MNKIIYISDYFADEIVGGGELNDYELINIFLSNNIEIFKIKSNCVDIAFLQSTKNQSFIISNFIGLNKNCVDYITDNVRYVIYEHDHKYLISRNPAIYENFIAPKEQIINFNFYKNAKSILCQSNLHKSIVYNNLNLNNIISLSGNLWSNEILDYIESISNNQKNDSFAILDSQIEHKNTFDAEMFCKYKNYQYTLIKDQNYKSFLNKLSLNKGLVFFPKTPETLSRLCVEARMLNLEVITNNFVGASKEEWFKLKGKDLIDFCRNMRYNIFDIVKSSL